MANFFCIERQQPDGQWSQVSDSLLRAVCGTLASYHGARNALAEGREVVVAGVRFRRAEG